MKRKIKDTILKIILFILLMAIVVLGFLIYERYNNPSKKDIKKVIHEVIIPSTDENEFTIDWDSLLAINSDVVGWIYVPDVDISFPVLQGINNDVYLHTTIYKNFSEFGSIFLDSYNDGTFSDDNSIIYGHSVQYLGGMFTNLKKFANEEFFNEHQKFYLLTPNGNYECDVFVFALTDGGAVYYYHSLGDIGGERMEVLNKFKASATYINDADVEDTDRLITLSTCDLAYGTESDRRIVLVGVLHEYQGDIHLED